MGKRLYACNVGKLFCITALNALIFAYVIERIFGLERGLSILEIQYITIIYAVVSLALEIPSGVLADKWKKKYVLALGYAFCFFEFFISIFAHSFTVFSLAFLLAAVGGSLKSGVVDAILYLSLREIGIEGQFEKKKAQIKFVKYAVSGLAGITGGYIAHKWGLEANYWLSLVGFPFAIYICLTLTEPVTSSPDKRSRTFLNHVGQALKAIKTYPTLGLVILYGGMMGAVLYGQLHEMSSIAYPELGIAVKNFGYISLIITVFGGLGGILASIVRKKLGYTVSFTLILFASIVWILLFSVSTVWWHIIFLVGAICTMEMVSPLTSGYIHQRADDEFRVTISSLEAFVLNGLTIMVGIIFGYIADLYGIFAGFKAMAILLAVTALTVITLWFSYNVRLNKKQAT